MCSAVLALLAANASVARKYYRYAANGSFVSPGGSYFSRPLDRLLWGDGPIMRCVCAERGGSDKRWRVKVFLFLFFGGEVMDAGIESD